MLFSIYQSVFSWHLTINKIVLLTLLFLLLVILIITAIILTIVANFNRKKNQILKDLEFCKNINLKEKMSRIKLISTTNKEYKKIYEIWTWRYQKILDNNCQNIIKNFYEILNFQNEKKFKQRNLLIRQTVNLSKKTVIHLKKISLEIDYFITIDQLIGEQQLFFQQIFNFWQTEIIKINLQNKMNEQQLIELINILNNKFKTVEQLINNADIFSAANNLDEIATGVIVLSEIIINLPNINYYIQKVILDKIAKIKEEVLKIKDKKFLNIFNNLEIQVTQDIFLTKELVNNLQYKKSKVKIKEIMKKINNFEKDLSAEKNFTDFFISHYPCFFDINLNLSEVFDEINKNFANTKLADNNFLIDDDEIYQLKKIIKEKLLTLNSLESQLTIEVNKTDKILTYQLIFLMFKEYLEQTIIIFDFINDYNKLIMSKIKTQLNTENSIYKLNSMILQIENFLSNLKYLYLRDKYFNKFTILQKKFETINNFLLTNSVNDFELIIKNLSNLENEIFNLYQSIKINYIFSSLVSDTLVFANRFRSDENITKQKFITIEELINQENYEQALLNLINLIS